MAGVEQAEVTGLKVVEMEPRGFVHIYLEQVHPNLRAELTRLEEEYEIYWEYGPTFDEDGGLYYGARAIQ